MSGNLFQEVLSRLKDPQAVFIDDGRRKITYQAAFELSAQYANVLAGEGVATGDRIAVQVEKSPEAIILYLACLRVGAVFLPLNTAYTTAELEYFLDDSGPGIVVCAPEKLATISPIATKLSIGVVLTLGVANDGTLPALAADASPAHATVTLQPSDLAAILYTSGTTGRSKGAMLTHANLVSNARSLVECWRYTRDDVLLHALPIFHAHGLFVGVNVVMFSGSSMILLPKFDLETIRRELPRATTMMGVPTFYTRLLKESWLDAESASHIRLFISGSAPLSAETHRQWSAVTGHRILERYGMTETVMIASNPYDGDRVPGSVGLPLPDVELRVTDPQTCKVLPPGDVGSIEVRGPNVFRGYWRMPDKTKAEFTKDGFFITGDMGFIDRRGYVFIVGRSKELIITGGYNVYPKEVEAAIDALPGVVESAVIGLPHSDLGEEVTAAVVLRAGDQIISTSIEELLEKQLAKYKVPKRIVLVEKLPRNAMGKVVKSIIREMLS